MRLRTPALVGGWAVAVVVATGVGWAGVNLVADEVSPSSSSALSQAEVERRIHAATATASPASGAPSSPAPSSPSDSTPSGPTPSAPSAGTSQPPVVRRSVTARGGTVVLECAGAVITAKSSPGPGYAVSEDSQLSGTTVLVVFGNGAQQSQVQGSCVDGAPVPVVRETQGGGEE